MDIENKQNADNSFSDGNTLNFNSNKENHILKNMYFKILPQQMIYGFVFMLNTIIDSFITSRFLGSEAMAALGFYTPVSNVLFLCYVFITGTQVMCGNSIGRGKSRKTVSIFSTCVVVILIYSLLCSVCM
jgi:Na+-driven multidrug efflux pump